MDTFRYVIGWGKVVVYNLPLGQEVYLEDANSSHSPAVRFYTLSYHEIQKPISPAGMGFFSRYGDLENE